MQRSQGLVSHTLWHGYWYINDDARGESKSGRKCRANCQFALLSLKAAFGDTRHTDSLPYIFEEELMQQLLQDLRFGARMLLKKPGFTLIAALTLALGIGANTAIFSVIDAALSHPLPFDESERLMEIKSGAGYLLNLSPAQDGGEF